MPLFDYSLFHDVAVTLHRSTNIPTGGAAKSLNINLPSSGPLTTVMLRRNRGGPPRGSHEVRLGVLSQVGGSGAGGGIFMALQSSLGNKRLSKDPRDASAYALEFDKINADLVHLKDGILPTSNVLFTGTGMTLGVVPPVGPGNWFHILMQLKVNADLSAILKIRKSQSAVNAGSPTWVRIPGMPDVTFEPAEAKDPGWFGLYAVGTTGDLMRFNNVRVSNTLTAI